MFSLTVDDPNYGEVFTIKSSDENDFIHQVLSNGFFEFALDELENCDNYDEDIGWHTADDLIADIVKNMPDEVDLTYIGGE